MRTRLARRAVTTVAAAIAAGTALAGPVHAEPGRPTETIDLQAHRGGRGEHTEESLYGFARALELGVTTLELDIIMTKDGVPLVWHDPDVQAAKCIDTIPASPGDKQFPYVGKDLHDLTYRQVQTLVCDKKLPDFPDAKRVLGNRIATLPQLFALAAQYKNNKVRFNIETKIEAEQRTRSATPREFVSAILREVRKAHLTNRVEIQSFDWRSLPLVRKEQPNIPLVALYDATTWKPKSQWLGPVSYEKFDGDVVAAAKSAGFDILSPDFTLSDKDLVDRAHAAHLAVIPWTVDEAADMRAQLSYGVDGIITDYPTRLRSVFKAEGVPLPTKYRR
ncbi:glycerophosphodiester phosphodiesterase [Gordonia humi]|uniref:Glycerophosphoryl diester phosphodiesterase n=1 Tax=Gordonia humi TaxID=686429 RepID=A0A840ES54_9ACTN|nr:glycerophosphodiester phosphodiesterase [Gordonia humi]MBB4135675.1 glycerophosphoryl diester phosphodiesterase [Gordonia humi]